MSMEGNHSPIIEELKRCACCMSEKHADDFYTAKTGKLMPLCKVCHNKECIRRRKIKDPTGETTKRWKSRNPSHKEKQSQYMVKWKNENRDKIRESRKRNRKAWKKSPSTKLFDVFRRRLASLVKSKKETTSAIIGCSGKFLKQWIESQFTKGMSWDNYGKWHIDHILPCASFDHNDEYQVKQCWNWQNLRPLWAAENIAKGATITHPQGQLPLCF